MAPGTGEPVLSFLYVVVISAVYGVLILFGYSLDRLPVVPGPVTRGYHRVMFAALFVLSRPIDGWVDRVSEPVAGAVAEGSSP